MIFYANAKVVASGRNEGVDEGGAPFHWFDVVVKDDKGNRATLGTGMNNFEDFEGQEGVLEIRITDESNGKKKVRAVAFQPNETLDLPEKEIH